MLFHDLTGKKSRQYVLATLIFVNLGYTWSLDSDLIRDFVLNILLRYIHVFQKYDQWIKNTIYVIHYTVLIIGKFGHSTVIEEILIKQWFNQTICVSYITKMNSSSSHDLTGKQIRHYVLATVRFVNLWYTWSWYSDLIRDFVLTILPR